jgi:hypothetical protein
MLYLHDYGHLETLQLEHGLAKLEKASKDLCSQLCTHQKRPYATTSNLPLREELQAIEEMILKHHQALRVSRMEAAKAIEQARKGNIYLGFP